MITNEQFELHPWRTTEVQNNIVDYYILQSKCGSVDLYLRVTSKIPSYKTISDEFAMAECWRVKNYIINEGYLDELVDNSIPFNGESMIYSLFVYQRYNSVIHEGFLDRVVNWLKEKIL